MNEKASIPQVLAKTEDLKKIIDEEFWKDVTIPELERLRVSIRDLMQFLKGEGIGRFDIDITDEITLSPDQPEGTVFDIRTYKEKVIDYLMENSESEVIRKIHNLEPINTDDFQELERILWHELGTKVDYDNTTQIGNLAVFVRSLIGLSQEAVNEKFGQYLAGNMLNSQQQEFVKTIINYVRENGDVELSDLVNNEPFSNYDLHSLFGTNLPKVVSIVSLLHDAVTAQA